MEFLTCIYGLSETVGTHLITTYVALGPNFTYKRVLLLVNDW